MSGKSFTGQQLRRLETAFRNSYRDETDLKRLFTFELSVPLDVIYWKAPLRDVIFSIVEWAKNQNLLFDLVQAAAKDRPGNQELQNLLAEFSEESNLKKIEQKESQPPAYHPGQILSPGILLKGRYRIQKQIIRVIYLAVDEKLNRLCVVKQNLNFAGDDKRQFGREARFLARLDHPALPDVYDFFDIPEEGQYLVMTYIPGIDLQQLVKQKGPLPPEEAINWISQISHALIYLHSQTPPLIHRDVKPANIRLTPDADRPEKAMLIDFGAAKEFHYGQKTSLGAQVITSGYSPPEQYTYGGTDVRSDVYALGATSYYLLTGQKPVESIKRMKRDTLRLPNERNGHLNRTLSDTVMKAMALDPLQRFGTMQDFLEALMAGKPTPDQVPKTILPPKSINEARPTFSKKPSRLASNRVPTTAGPGTPEKKPKIGEKKTASRPVNWFHQNITALTYATIALCITSFTLALTVLYVNNLPANALSDVTETPTAPAVTFISTATPTITPSPTETATPTFTLTNSTKPTHTVTPTNTPVPPEIQKATLQAMDNFAVANALSTPPGNYILAENEVVELEHDSAIGPAFYRVEVAQEDFVIRAVFTNPYDADEGQWDYGFFLRIQPDDDERFSVSVTSDKNWEIRHHEDTVDADGTIVGEGEIENLNIGGGGINILMVIMAGENGYLIVNEGEIFPLDLSRIVAPGVIQVVTGIRPGHKAAGAITQFWDLSIYDLTTE